MEKPNIYEVKHMGIISPAAMRRTIFPNCTTCCDTAEPRRITVPDCLNFCDTAAMRRTIFPNCTTCCDMAEAR